MSVSTRERSLVTIAVLMFLGTAAVAQQPAPRSNTQEGQVNTTALLHTTPYGWHTDYLGPFRGTFDMSVGVKAWSNLLQLDNFVFSANVDLLPGLRARLGFRRKEGKQLLHLQTDEIYLEAFDNYHGRTVDGAVSLRIGHIRYLHVPYPDAISIFDPVPGTLDQYSPVETDYRSVVLDGEMATHSGFGFHWSGRLAGFTGHDSLTPTVMAAYAFYRSDLWHSWHFETRLGDLAVRNEPLGRAGQPGYDLYMGKQVGDFNVGLLYEHKQTEADFTGIAVQFKPGSVANVFGKYTIDYSRHPDGFTAQVPLLHFRFNEDRSAPTGAKLVGEIRAVRMRTIDAQGFTRNQYEHRLQTWGRTGDRGLICVVHSHPWYIQAEALVSPHTSPDSKWFHDRSGPGQYVQLVTYRFYSRG